MCKVRSQSHSVLAFPWISITLRCIVITSASLEIASREVKERNWDKVLGKHLVKGRAQWGCPDDQRFRMRRDSGAGTLQQKTKKTDIWQQRSCRAMILSGPDSFDNSLTEKLTV